MTTPIRSTTWTLVLYGAFFPVTAALSEDRPAEQILKELDGLQAPRVEATKRNDEKYFQEFLRKRNQVWSTRDALILEFYKVAPHHQRIPKLMAERWAHFVYTPPYSLESLKEIDEILARDTNPELKIEGTYVKAVAKIRLGPGGSPDLSAAEEFISLAPNDHRCAVLLRMAGRSTDDQKKKAALEERVIMDYPSSEIGKVLIRRRLDAEPDLKAKEALEDRVLTHAPGTNLAGRAFSERGKGAIRSASHSIWYS